MANKVFRQTLTAGVVMASAGAIALTPVTVTPELRAVDTPRVVTTEVLPAGLVQDLQLIGNGARAAVEQSADALTRKIPDLWWTVHEQWPDADLLHWNYALVTDIFLAPITPLIIGPLNDAVAEAVARNFPILGDEIRAIPDFVEYAFVRLIGPVLSAIGGAGVAHSEIFYSMTTLRIEPFIKAIVRAPFNVIDGLLFGGYGDLGPILPGREGEYIPAPGLLTPWGQQPPVRDIKTPNDIVDTTLGDIDATVVSLVTDLVEKVDGTEPAAELVEGTETEPGTEAVVTEPGTELDIIEPAVTEPAVIEPEVTEPVRTEPSTTPVKVEAPIVDAELPVVEPAKQTKKDPAAAIRQGVKDFRDNVGRTVQKLTGGGTSAGAESSADDKKDKADKTETKSEKSETKSDNTGSDSDAKSE